MRATISRLFAIFYFFDEKHDNYAKRYQKLVKMLNARAASLSGLSLHLK